MAASKITNAVTSRENTLFQNSITTYKEHTVKELKKALQHLKSNKGNLSEIRYVSRALRDKLRNNSNNADGLNSNESFFNHDQYLGRNFGAMLKIY